MNRLTLSVTQALHEDHLSTLALLERFETLLARHPAKRPPAANAADVAALLDDVVAVLENEIDNHFAFEEEHLFPRFAAFAGPGIPAMLGSEHEAIRPLARRLVALAREAAASGFSAEAWAEFHRLGGQLVEREVFHVQKEEMGFLPALDQSIGAEDDSALLAAYEAMKGAGG